MILANPIEVQGAFLTTRAPLKSSQSEDLVTSKKHPLEAIGTHKIIPKIHKSLVLAHNIHKDCLLGVVRGFSDDIWCEALSSIICSEGPEGENQGFNAKVFQINFKCFVLAIYGSLN